VSSRERYWEKKEKVMSKDTKAILERRAELIKELTEEPQLRTRTGVKAGATAAIRPVMCLSIIPITPIIPIIMCLTPVYME
jgi:hypothetical protein